jgi:hypothetical protein
MGNYSGNFNNKRPSLPNGSQLPASVQRSHSRDFTKFLNRIQQQPFNNKQKSFISTNFPVLSPKSGFIEITDPSKAEEL